MAHPLYGPELRYMLLEANLPGMKAFVETLNPTTVASALVDDEFTTEQVWSILGQADPHRQALVFEYLPIETQVRLAIGAGRPQMAKLIELMSSDDRVDLLRKLPEQVSEALIRLVDEADRKDIAKLFQYEEDTVGAIMTTDYAWIPAGLTAGQAIDRLRQQAPDRETIYYIFVLDEGSRKLLGVLSLRNLVLADRNTPVKKIMLADDLTVLKASDDQAKAAGELGRYDLLAIPVLDDDGRLVGIVTHDDVLDVVTQEATEDMQKQAGVGPFSGNYLETGFFEIWRKRAMWLSILFFAELATFSVMAYFDDLMAKFLVLTLFVPLCISTGGNSGSQAATLITRSLALGHVRARDWFRVLRHEFVMGLVLGLTLGAIGLLRGASTSSDLRSAKKELDNPVEVIVPKGVSLASTGDGKYELPLGAEVAVREPTKKKTSLTLAEPGATPEQISHGDKVSYLFPAGTISRVEAVDRWSFALVIGQSVAFICLWGTIIGSMLPLAFHRFGIDPALASSPFVATFVDVTGIAAFLMIATLWLS